MTPSPVPGAALPVVRHDPPHEPRRHPDVKDPSPVFDGEGWHLFGTGCGVPQGVEILHLRAPALAGPWREEPPSVLRGVDFIRHPSAPGVVADGATLHMFLQHNFNILGGRIEHLVSHDGGTTFVRTGIGLGSEPGAGEAGVYDPDAVEVDGRRYLTYAAMTVVGQPDLYLAVSPTDSWDGPWERLGCILDHPGVPFHNQVGQPGYEWGLEGPQLLRLPGSGLMLLTAVCFLPDRPAGHRQRLLLAAAERVTGPYSVLGAVVPPTGWRGRGENGHGTAVFDEGLVHLVYQERRGEGRPWRYLRATVAPDDLVRAFALTT
ncbi:MAG: hypothetical protein ACR2HV_00715 [Acidimicrobiales bacterium]